MATNKLEKHIAKACLLWIVASVRKLTISELALGLKLDIDTVMPSAKMAIEGLCGQLVSADEESVMVDLVHPTVREFIVSSAGEFTVSTPQAHGRVALACLKLMSGDELRPSRSRQFPEKARQEPSPRLEYAMTQFSEHVCLAPSEDKELLAVLDRFFRTNVLCWIERLAMQRDLICLIRASENLLAYLDREPRYQSFVSSQKNNIESWCIDLNMLVTTFGEALLEDPSAIYSLIPALCPSGSAICQRFGRRPDGLSLVGRQSISWDDSVAYVTFGEDIAVAMSCEESLIAVGMESGDVHLYNSRSCEKEGIIHQETPLDLVHLFTGLMASCTIRSVLLQDLEGNVIWERQLISPCILLTSCDECIVAVSEAGNVLRWNKETGKQVDDRKFPFRHDEVRTNHNGLAMRAPRAPCVASISPDMEVLALGYASGDVCLWDIPARELLRWAKDGNGKRPSKLFLNPKPNAESLLVIYEDHGLAIYDPWSGNLVQANSTPYHAA